MPRVGGRDADDAPRPRVRPGGRPVSSSPAAERPGRSAAAWPPSFPRSGFDDEPISPVSRDETVTKKKPQSTTSTRPPTQFMRSDGGQGDRQPPAPTAPGDAPATSAGRVRSAGRPAGRACRRRVRSPRPARIEPKISGRRLHEADQPPRGDRPRADVEDVVALGSRRGPCRESAAVWPSVRQRAAGRAARQRA